MPRGDVPKFNEMQLVANFSDQKDKEMDSFAKNEGNTHGDGTSYQAENGVTENLQISNIESSQGLENEEFEKDVGGKSLFMGKEITSTGGRAEGCNIKSEGKRKRKRTEVSLRYLYLKTTLKICI